MSESLINNSRPGAVRTLAAGVGLGALGALMVFPPSGMHGSSGGTAIGIGLLVLAGLSLLTVPFQWFKRSGVSVDREGMRSVGEARDWSVGWDEVHAVSVPIDQRFRRQVTRRGGTYTNARIALDLVPADSGFAARHPELREMRKVDGTYRVRVGDSPSLARKLDAALTAHSSGRYQGAPELRATGARPWQLTVGVGLCVAAWLAILIRMITGELNDGGDLFALAVYGLAVPLWIYRAWRGGPKAVPNLARIAVGIGGPCLVLMVYLSRGDRLLEPVILGPVIACLLLICAGVLLSHRQVKAWVEALQYGKS